MAITGDLLPGIAHNIGTPLTGIIGYADLIKSVNPNLKDVEQILKQAHRIDEILKNVMHKLRYESEKELSLVNINEIVKVLLKFMQAHHVFKHDCHSRIELAPDMPLVPVSYPDITRCFMMLIFGAMKLVAESANKEVAFRTSFDDQYAYFQIEGQDCQLPVWMNHRALAANSGLQMNNFALMKKEAFKEFILARHIIRKNNASLTVDCSPGIGFKIQVSLPRK